MAEPLRILILEDNPADVELIKFELEEAGLAFTSKVVMVEEDYVRQLQEFSPDLIISDYDLPKYNGLLALTEAKRRRPDTPFILVTGAVTEDRAIDILTQGAKDYVLKTRLQQRLAPAIQRAIAEAAEQKARRKAEEELRETHRNLENMVAERTVDLRREIEHRRRIEQDLLRYNERLELLSYTASRLLASEKPQQIVEELCQKVMKFLDCDAFFNFLVDETAGRLHLNACAGIPKETARTIEWLDYGVAICGCAARDACRLVAENIPETPDVRTELVKSFGIKAYACHPLMEQDRVLGTLSFGTRSRTSFSTSDLAMMKAVADQVAIAMSRVRTENALRESESVLRAFFDSPGQPRGVVEVVDDKMRFVSVNKVAAAAYGLTPETMRGKFVSELDIPRELMQVYLEGCKGALQKGLISFEVFHQLPDTGRWFVVTGSYLGNGPTGFPRFAFVMLDITRRKKAEEKMRESESLLRAFFDSPGMLRGIVEVVDGNIQYVSANEAIASAYGLEPDAVNGKTISELGTPPDVVQVYLERCEEARQSGRIVSFEVFRHLAGGDKWLLVTASYLGIGPTGSPRFAFVMLDITERKQVEETLRQSEKQYRTLFNSMTEGFAIHEIITDEQGTPVDYRFLDINPAFERLTGLKRADVVGKTHNELLPGDDPKWLLMFGGVALTGKPVQFENYSPALKRHYDVLAYRPAPRQFAVIFMDVTERKRNDEAIQFVLQRFHALLSSIRSGILLVGEDGIELANQAFCDYFGLTEPPADLIGLTAGQLIEKIKSAYLHPEEEVIRIREIIDLGQPVIGEEIAMQGERTCLRDFVPISIDGKVYGRLWNHTDITKRKRAEEALRERERLLQDVMDGSTSHRIQES